MNRRNRRWQSIKPMNKHLLLAFEQEDEVELPSGLVVTQLYKPKNHYRVLGVADDLDYDIKINEKVFLNRITQAKWNTYVVNDNERVLLVPQMELLAVKRNDGLIPLGRRVLIKRRNITEMDLKTKIITHAFQSDQTLKGEVVALGLIEKPSSKKSKSKKKKSQDFQPIEVGDTVMLEKWDASMAEISIGNRYFLIVPERFIQYILTEHEVTQEEL